MSDDKAKVRVENMHQEGVEDLGKVHFKCRKRLQGAPGHSRWSHKHERRRLYT